MSSTPIHAIREAKLSELPALAEGLATAFHEDDVSVWAFPDPSQRHAQQQGMFRAFLELAHEAGIVQTTADASGAAIWMPSNVEPTDSFERQLSEAFGADEPRVHAVSVATNNQRPSIDHYLLPFIGAFTTGRGIGTALLQHGLAEQQENEYSVYIEASNARSAQLYQRLGFVPLDEVVIRLGNDVGPIMRPMLWTPEPTAS